VLYLATASGPKVRDAMTNGVFGQMVTYKSGNRVTPDTTFAIDNGVVKMVEGLPVTDPEWDPNQWQDCLDRHIDVPGCLFAAVPDAVSDTDETDRRWRRWASAVSRRGYRCAYVAQDGCRRIPAGAEVVFLGGSDRFKLGPEGRSVVEAAHATGRRVHMGRVNSLRRLRYAASLGCDSVDGTFLAFGPDANIPRLVRYLRRAAEPTLWGPP
jgi:hypothetical protein